jgi:hypothetical protein
MSFEPKEIRAVLGRISVGHRTTVPGLIAMLQDVQSKIPAGTDVTVRMDGWGQYLHIETLRLETPLEVQARITREENRLQRLRETELQQYHRLQKKLGFAPPTETNNDPDLPRTLVE